MIPQLLGIARQDAGQVRALLSHLALANGVRTYTLALPYCLARDPAAPVAARTATCVLADAAPASPGSASAASYAYPGAAAALGGHSPGMHDALESLPPCGRKAATALQLVRLQRQPQQQQRRPRWFPPSHHEAAPLRVANRRAGWHHGRRHRRAASRRVRDAGRPVIDSGLLFSALMGAQCLGLPPFKFRTPPRSPLVLPSLPSSLPSATRRRRQLPPSIASQPAMDHSLPLAASLVAATPLPFLSGSLCCSNLPPSPQAAASLWQMWLQPPWKL